MSSVLLGRESFDPQETKCGRKELEASKPRGAEVVEEVQPRPTRFRGLVGGAWQRVRTMFRRSSSSSAGDAGDEEKPEVAAENSESHPVSLAGDFRILPPSAWQTLHARFLTTKIEQDTFVAGPGQEQASQDLANKPLKPAAGAAAPEVTVGAASPREAKAELEAEAVPIEPSIRSAEAAPAGKDLDYLDEPFEEQASEELEDKPLKPAAGAPALEVTVGASPPPEAKAELEAEPVPIEPSIRSAEEQASQEMEDKPLKPAAGAAAPEVTVGAASPLEAELEAEAVPSEPSIRAEAFPVSRSSEYGDEAFEEQASQELENKPLKPAAGAAAPEVTVGAASPLEAKAELEAEAVPSEPSIRSAEASPVSPGSDYGDEAFEEMPSEKPKDKTHSLQEGQPAPEATAPSSVEEELKAEAVPSEPSIRSAEASPRLPMEPSSEPRDEASPAGKYSDYADEPFEEQVSAELQEGTPEPSGGEQVPEGVVHTPSPAEAAPAGKDLDYLDEPFEEQASEELEDKPLKPAAGAPALEVTVGASPPPEAKAELEAEAVPSEPSIRSAEGSPVSPGSDYGDEAFEEMPSEKLEDTTQKPLEGQPTPEATARAPSSVEASPRLPLERSSEHADEASPVDRSSDCGGYGSDFEQEPEDKPFSGGPAAVPGGVAMDAAESSDRPASPAGSDYSDEAFEEQISAELQLGQEWSPEPSGGMQVPEVVIHAPSPREEQLSEELEESPMKSPGGPLAPETMGRAPSPTEEADGQYDDAFEKEDISEELEDVAEPRALPLGAPARDPGEEGFQERLEGSPISNLSSDPSGPFETEIDSGMEDLDTSGDFPDSEEPMKVIEEGDAIFNDLGMRQAGMLPTVDENSSEDEDEDNFDAEPSSVFSRPTPSMFETAGKPGERPTSSSSHSTVTSTSELFGARLRPSSAGASRSESRPGSARPGGNRPTSAGTEMSQPSPVLSDGEDVEDEPISVGTESASRSDVGDSELEEIEEALAAPSPPAPAPCSFRPPPPPEAPQQVLGPNFGHRYSEEFESDEDELT